MARWIPLPALRQRQSLRPRRGCPQVVSVLRLQTPDLADRGQSDGAHQTAADDMVPRELVSVLETLKKACAMGEFDAQMASVSEAVKLRFKK